MDLVEMNICLKSKPYELKKESSDMNHKSKEKRAQNNVRHKACSSYAMIVYFYCNQPLAPSHVLPTFHIAFLMVHEANVGTNLFLC